MDKTQWTIVILFLAGVKIIFWIIVCYWRAKRRIAFILAQSNASHHRNVIVVPETTRDTARILHHEYRDDEDNMGMTWNQNPLEFTPPSYAEACTTKSPGYPTDRQRASGNLTGQSRTSGYPTGQPNTTGYPSFDAKKEPLLE
ncbi:uncharacterized protein LOC127834627 [Dreissena polymorpha]|uniref:Uncharacterized protein n=1 Tax=Dreissena polymorpha TaxID=45954 RepID=A0A9D4G7Q9_DREPO|nr:uncharacterized protein LOC127834627 [Dreissena polymorpha]KAH3812018.1 hypothetical protein DPMN_140439 [Dreissena polymorpha]